MSEAKKYEAPEGTLFDYWDDAAGLIQITDVQGRVVIFEFSDLAAFARASHIADLERISGNPAAESFGS